MEPKDHLPQKFSALPIKIHSTCTCSSFDYSTPIIINYMLCLLWFHWVDLSQPAYDKITRTRSISSWSDLLLQKEKQLAETFGLYILPFFASLQHWMKLHCACICTCISLEKQYKTLKLQSHYCVSIIIWWSEINNRVSALEISIICIRKLVKFNVRILYLRSRLKGIWQ